MKSNTFLKLTGTSLAALGLAVAPMAYTPVQAQDSTQTPESVESDESAAQNFEEAEESLEEAGSEAVDGVEAAGEAAGQQINQTTENAAEAAQEASQAAQQAGQEAVQEAEEAAERAEIAAENAVASIEQRSNWGWLGLFGLIGLFGLAGGNSKRRIETDQKHYTDRPTTTAAGDYRS